jgi:hypothetical protein
MNSWTQTLLDQSIYIFVETDILLSDCTLDLIEKKDDKSP